jgi:predicted nucleic acid-binding protein
VDLPDINVLIYAHREDSPEHERYAAWLRRLVSGAAPFALSSFTLGVSCGS